MFLEGYFDYNATTPICHEAICAFKQALEEFANPSSHYNSAKSNKNHLVKARQQVAQLIGSDSSEIVFTSGGTEANNWGIKGALTACGAFARDAEPSHLIVSEIEHASVLEVAKFLQRYFGFEVTYIKPNTEGVICAKSLEAHLQSNTRLISIMMVNNEVGAVQPIKDIVEILRTRPDIHLHVDGVQAVGKMILNVHDLGVDTFSFAAHKFYGPKGVGGLYIRRGVCLEPLIHGGGQESGLRGGTEPVAAIAAMGAAAEAALTKLPELLLRVSKFRILLKNILIEQIPGVSFHGPIQLEQQIPNTLSICVDGIRAEALAALLDQMHDIQISLGSACSNNHKVVALSHVLTAMGLSESEIKATLRVSIGQYTQEKDLYRFVEAMAKCVRTLRQISRTTVDDDKNIAA